MRSLSELADAQMARLEPVCRENSSPDYFLILQTRQGPWCAACRGPARLGCNYLNL